MKWQNDLFIRTALGEEVERPPVWLMRQAGRILPQYRELRAGLGDFKELVKRPDLAAEATLQPLDELGVDAAIIFSDILVVPEAMGLDYEMEERIGPVFPNVITDAATVRALRSGTDAADQLEYVYQALAITKQRLEARVPLIGFSGTPWTLLAYMVEGKGSKTFSKAKAFLYREEHLAHALLDKLTDTIIAYLKRQIAHGADLVQLFDSWAGILSQEQYRSFSVPYIRQICAAITEVPVTVFAKGAWFALEDWADTACEVVGLDWTMSPVNSRQQIGPDKILQGNLDPCQLYASEEAVATATLDMLDQFGRRHIANLGHGVYPDTPLPAVKSFVNTVKNYRYPIA
ncbi:MAG TPA: uroporphyrinogen decarboxylase [Saprospiraceae bacterium]|nr:uroporphyrinogen decarboxylase [Saprospiraceae bacterium]HMQ84536.1 uroporphyrinogen decarboxylase [Saprospiraceae bacterium]